MPEYSRKKKDQAVNLETLMGDRLDGNGDLALFAAHDQLRTLFPSAADQKEQVHQKQHHEIRRQTADHAAGKIVLPDPDAQIVRILRHVGPKFVHVSPHFVKDRTGRFRTPKPANPLTD